VPPISDRVRRWRWAALAVPALATLAALSLWLTLPGDDVKRLTAEVGWIEQSTVWFYFLAAALFALRFGAPHGRGTRAALAVLMLALGARELDLHKAFTGISMLKGSFYLGSAPWSQKLAGLLVVATVVVATVALLRWHAVGLWRRFREGDAAATTVFIFFVTLIVSKMLDRSVNLLAEDYGVVTPPSIDVLIRALEEILELSLPLIVLVGWWQSRVARPSPVRPTGLGSADRTS
jgi:predicted MFS family arabinose efflux permease